MRRRVSTSGAQLFGGYNARPRRPESLDPGDDPGVSDRPSARMSARGHRFGGVGHEPVRRHQDVQRLDQHRSAGRQARTVSHELQAKGFAIGVVTSVPISHATPACTYAHNVSRDDFQDLTRDLLGLPSIAHRSQPLPGVDVLLGSRLGRERRRRSQARRELRARQ